MTVTRFAQHRDGGHLLHLVLDADYILDRLYNGNGEWAATIRLRDDASESGLSGHSIQSRASRANGLIYPALCIPSRIACSGPSLGSVLPAGLTRRKIPYTSCIPWNAADGAHGYEDFWIWGISNGKWKQEGSTLRSGRACIHLRKFQLKSLPADKLLNICGTKRKLDRAIIFRVSTYHPDLTNILQDKMYIIMYLVDTLMFDPSTFALKT